MEKHQWLWIVIGPNGSGKSTFIQKPNTPLSGLPYLNPEKNIGDAIRQNVSIYSHTANYDFFKEVEKYSSQGSGFVTETTLPGITYTELVKHLQQEGWKVGVICISVATPEIAKMRVNTRFTQGGHGAWSEQIYAIWRFYPDAMAKLLALSDKFYIYDNTQSDFLLLASGENGKVDLSIDKALIGKANAFLGRTIEALDKKLHTASVKGF